MSEESTSPCGAADGAPESRADEQSNPGGEDAGRRLPQALRAQFHHAFTPGVISLLAIAFEDVRLPV